MVRVGEETGIFEGFWLERRCEWLWERSVNSYRWILLRVGLREGDGFVDRTGIFDGVVWPWTFVGRPPLAWGVGVICTFLRDGEASDMFLGSKIERRFWRIVWRSSAVLGDAGGRVRGVLDVICWVEIYNGRNRKERPCRRFREFDWNRKSPCDIWRERERIDKSYRTRVMHAKRLELLKRVRWCLEIPEKWDVMIVWKIGNCTSPHSQENSLCRSMRIFATLRIVGQSRWKNWKWDFYRGDGSIISIQLRLCSTSDTAFLISLMTLMHSPLDIDYLLIRLLRHVRCLRIELRLD